MYMYMYMYIHVHTCTCLSLRLMVYVMKRHMLSIDDMCVLHIVGSHTIGYSS